MAAFDPDAYLGNQTATPSKFDPDEYLGTPKKPAGILETVGANVAGGLGSQLLGAGAAATDYTGLTGAAKYLDEKRKAVEEFQKNHGGDTTLGRISSGVGGLAPALLLPEAGIPALLANAGAFALPGFRDTYKAQTDAGASPTVAAEHALADAGLMMVGGQLIAKGGKALPKSLQASDKLLPQLAQAGGEGAAFTAGNTAVSKGIDVANKAAGNQTAQGADETPWLDPRAMAESAASFGALRGIHRAIHGKPAPVVEQPPATSPVDTTAPPPTAPAVSATPAMPDYGTLFEARERAQRAPKSTENDAKVAELTKQMDEVVAQEQPPEPAAFAPEANADISARLNKPKSPEIQNENTKLPEIQPANEAGGRERGVELPIQPADVTGAEATGAAPTGAPEEPSGQRLVSAEQPASTGNAIERAQPSALAELPPLPEAPKHPDEVLNPKAAAGEAPATPEAPAETKAAANEVAPEVTSETPKAPITVVDTKTTRGDSLTGASTKVKLSDGSEHELKREDTNTTAGLPGWHDVNKSITEFSYLGNTKAEAIQELILRQEQKAAAAKPTVAAANPPAKVSPAERARQQEAAAVAAKLAEQAAASAKAKTAPEQRTVVGERGGREQAPTVGVEQVKGALRELLKSTKASPKVKAEAKVHLDDLSAKKHNAKPEDVELLHELAFNFLKDVAGGKRGLYQSPRENQPSMLRPGDVQKLADRITAGWKKAPPITVHADESTLPQKIIDQAKKDGMTGKITGVYDPDTKTVHLVEKNLKSAQDVESAIVHEVAGHHGLREILGARYGKIMDSLYHGNAAVRKAADEKMQGPNPLDQRTAVEEVLAEMAETGPQAPQERGALRRIYDAVKGFFQDVFGHRDVSDDAVRQIVANARTHVIEGGKAGKGLAGEGAALYQGRPDATDQIFKDMGREVPKEDTRSYAEKIKDTLAPAADTLKTKDGVGPIGRVLDAAIDMLDAGAPLQRAIEREVRATLPETEANRVLTAISYSQTSHDVGVGTAAIDAGGLKYDSATHKFKTEDSKFNRKALNAAYKEIIDRTGKPLSEVRAKVSAALESKRMLALLDMKDAMLAQANTLKAGGKLKAAKSLTAKAESYTFHMTRDQALKGMELYKAWPEIQKIDDIKEGMRGWLRTLMEDSGVWSPEYGQWMLDNAEWIPFQREMENDDTASGFNSYVRGLQVKAREPGFKGSLREVHDVMDNFEKWALYSASRSIKNQKSADLAKASLQYLPDTEARAVLYVNPKAANRTISYLEKGNLKYVEFDSASKAEIFKGNPAMAYAALPYVNGFVDGFNKIFRTSVVNSPLFPAMQLSMDAMSAIYISGLKPKYAFSIPYKAVTETIKTLRGTSEAHKELKRFGAVGVHDYNATLSKANAEVEAGLKQNNLWEKYKGMMHNVNLATDNGVRQAVYLAARESGLPEHIAVEKAFEIINFRTRVGNAGLAASARHVVFMNSFYAASRVTLKLLRKGDIAPAERAKAQKTLLSNLAWLGGLSAINAMMNTGDEDYEKLSRQQQASRLTLPGLHGWGIPLRPDAFLLVKLFAEQAVRQSTDKYADDPAKLRTVVSDALVNNLLGGSIPVELPEKLAVELEGNYNFFEERPIVGPGLEKLEGWRQYSPETSEFAKGVGATSKDVAKILGSTYTGLSPMKVDHFVRGTLGSYGGMFLLATNNLFGNRPTRSWQDTIATFPGLSRVGVREFANDTATDFHDLAEHVDEAVATANKLQSTGNFKEYQQYMDENRQKIRYEGYVKNIEDTLGVLRNQINRIAESNLPPDEKGSRIREVQLRQQRMMQNKEQYLKKVRTEALVRPNGIL